MQTKLKEILKADDFLTDSDGKSFIDFNGAKLSVSKLPDFQSKSTNYSSKYTLLNNHILIVNTSGKPSPQDITSAIDQQVTYFKNNGLSNITLVWNADLIGKPGIGVRKAMTEGNKKLSVFTKSQYLILPPKYKTLMRIFKFVYKTKYDHLLVADSIDDALSTLLAGSETDSEKKDVSFKLKWPDKATLLNKSKEELADMIIDYGEKYEKSTNKILKTLGHVSWGERFNTVEIPTEEDDIHFEMLNAFSLLQQDVEEIIREYQELNENLETKVAERVADFIDKESNLRSILDNSGSVIWLMNNSFELIDFNIAFVNAIKRRYEIDPKINDKILNFMTDEKERGVWHERFNTTLEGHSGTYLDQETVGGDERVYEIKTFPIKETGKIKGVSVFIEDITQLKQSQFKLIEKNKNLQKVNSELDSFVYRVSHDLRAPLTSILGLINVMKIETSQDKISEYVGLQEKSILKLDLFIKEIINLSMNSRLGITASKIDFDELISEIFKSQHYSLSKDHIQRLIEVEENISFYTDLQRLSIILNSLISNGLKYTNPHEANPYVKVRVSSIEDKCIIEVIDNGTGISETFLPKIFHMFFRASQDFSGSGLGLYIVKETVEKLNGKITVKSKMREGSTFKITLPNLKGRFDAAPKLED